MTRTFHELRPAYFLAQDGRFLLVSLNFLNFRDVDVWNVTFRLTRELRLIEILCERTAQRREMQILSFALDKLIRWEHLARKLIQIIVLHK